MNRIQYEHVQGGNVPGGHNVICGSRSGKPFITPMKECNSIPLRHSDVVVDIGAYCGTYAIRCARFPVKQVIAYEPTPHTFDILSLTQLPNMRLIQAAIVGDDQTDAQLFVSRGIGVTNSTVLSNRKAGAIAVPAVRYEKAVADATVVKIDVEGGEYFFDIVQPHLRAVMIDFHPVPGLDWIASAESIIARLEFAGFETVVKPDWSCGWTRAGSWLRKTEEQPGGYVPMLTGMECCGCGQAIISTGQKSLCLTCWDAWSKKHRKDFSLAEC